MTVTVDNAVESVRTGTGSPHTWSHAGAASGVKGVVVAAVHGTSSTDHVTAVSYGGVALSRKQRNVDTATEPGAAELWFLGAGVPQGTQTVSVTCGATTDDFHFVSITLLGARDLRVIDTDGIGNNVANPSVTLQYAGYSSMAFAALYGGGADPTAFTQNANCTSVHDHDLGAFYSEIIRQTTAGTADFAIGGTASSDDVAYAAIAVTDAEATGTVAQTDTRDTSSASGLVTVTGTAAVTDTRDASSASGLVTVTGTLAITDGRDTAAASGTVESAGITGTVAVTDGGDTSSASGVVLVTGTIAQTDARDVADMAGLVTVTGTAAVTDTRDVSAAAGVVAVIGSIAQTDARDAAAASGYVGFEPVTGTAAAADGRDTASASGEVSGGAQPASNDGAWRLLTGEYPKPLRRPEPRLDPATLPPLRLPRVTASPAPAAIVLPGLRIIADQDSELRERLLGDLIAPLGPSPAEIRRRRDEELAIALLLAA